MVKKEKSKGDSLLLHKRKLPNRPRLSAKGVGQVKDSIRGIMLDSMEGHGRDFVPVSIFEVRQKLRKDYDMFLTYRQVGRYMRQLVEEGILEKETHHTDRTAKHWSDQYSRYRFTQQPPDDPDDLPDSTPGPDPDRQDLGNGSDTPL